MAQIDSRLGDMIRSYREKLGLTQEEMAERLQVNLTHYGNIERAACNPSFSFSSDCQRIKSFRRCLSIFYKR